MFDQIPAEAYLIITTVGAFAMGLLAMFVRSKSAKKPASVKKSFYRHFLCRRVP